LQNVFDNRICDEIRSEIKITLNCGIGNASARKRFINGEFMFNLAEKNKKLKLKTRHKKCSDSSARLLIFRGWQIEKENK
jgi:hypothetical protein